MTRALRLAERSPTPSPTSPTTSVADVIARMQAIAAPLPANDGLACFIRLYLAVTEGVQARLAGISFEAPQFVTDLDRRFAELFFTACAATGGERPRAWAPLFEARKQSGVAPLQFALAGMNAHINRDLPVALVAACEHARIAPDEGTPQHRDYLCINNLLAAVEETIKSQYVTGLLRTLDTLVHPIHRLDDAIAMWDIGRARDAAWTHAEALWVLRETPPLYRQYLDALDEATGLAAHGLLTPADTWLAKLRRVLD
jgi:hypothetical protein